MKAITIWQPWAWAIAHAGKDVENRTWMPPKSSIGEQIAIHAGKRFDDDAVEFIQSIVPGGFYDDVPECAEDCITGAIIAIVTLAGVRPWGEGPARFSRWYGGPIGWLLSDKIVLPQPFFVLAPRGCGIYLRIRLIKYTINSEE